MSLIKNAIVTGAIQSGEHIVETKAHSRSARRRRCSPTLNDIGERYMSTRLWEPDA